MRHFARRFAFVSCCASLLLLGACGKHVEDNAPLSFAPADTPYLFANFKPLPDSVRQSWNKRTFQSMQNTAAAYTQLAAMLRDKSPNLARALEEAGAELTKIKSPQQLQQTTGFSQQAHSAIYGIGIAPVARIELADPNAFRGLIARIEKSIGHPFATAKLDNHDYWVIGDANDKLHALLAIEDKQAVATLAPANADPALLRQLLGLSKPEHSAADRLAKIDSDRGYTDYGSGYLDLPKLLAHLTDSSDAVTTTYASALHLPPPSSDPACKKEFAAIGAQVPLASFGYQQFDANEVRGSLDIALSAPLRGFLTALKQPVPGMAAQSDGALFDLVLAMPLQKWRTFWQARAQDVAAHPYTCPALTPLNATFRSMTTSLQQQMPPQAASLLGIRIALDQLVLGNSPASPTQMAGRVQVASTDPAALLQLAQKNLPQLAITDVKADGKPIPLSLPPQLRALAGGTKQAWIAADDHSIAMAIGTNEDNHLTGMLRAAAGDGSQSMRMHFDGRLYQTLADFSNSMAAKMPPAMQPRIQQQSQMMHLYAQWIKSLDVSTDLDDDGLHVKGDVKLAQ